MGGNEGAWWLADDWLTSKSKNAIKVIRKEEVWNVDGKKKDLITFCLESIKLLHSTISKNKLNWFINIINFAKNCIWIKINGLFLV